MQLTYFRAIFLSLAVLAVSACEQLPGTGPSVAVVDYAAVAKATGQEEFIQQQLQAAEENLNAQLGDIAQQLNSQLATEQEKLGETPDEESQVAFAQMTAQAQQAMGEKQQEARARAQQFQAGLVNQFREAAKPLVEEIAQARGATVVLTPSPNLIWFESTVDITADVIAAWRANPPEIPEAPVETPAPAAPEAAAEEPAETPAE